MLFYFYLSRLQSNHSTHFCQTQWYIDVIRNRLTSGSYKLYFRVYQVSVNWSVFMLWYQSNNCHRKVCLTEIVFDIVIICYNILPGRSGAVGCTSDSWVRSSSKAPVVSLSKKLYPYCLVLVGSRTGFERDFTIELK